jgi:hypothetical protein
MTPPSTPDLASTVARLEKENRHLITRLEITRLEKLEKQQGISYTALVANVVLLLCAALLVIYMGLIPLGTTRLPLRAGTVNAEEFVLSGVDGKVRARMVVDDKGFRVLDRAGKTLYSQEP